MRIYVALFVNKNKTRARALSLSLTYSQSYCAKMRTSANIFRFRDRVRTRVTSSHSCETLCSTKAFIYVGISLPKHQPSLTLHCCQIVVTKLSRHLKVENRFLSRQLFLLHGGSTATSVDTSSAAKLFVTYQQRPKLLKLFFNLSHHA